MCRRHFVLTTQRMQMQKHHWCHQTTGDSVGFGPYYHCAAATFRWTRSEFILSSQETQIHPDFLPMLIFHRLWAVHPPPSINISISISPYKPNVSSLCLL